MIVLLIFLALCCMFLLSDFYYSGIGRPFDYIAIVLLIFLFVFNQKILINAVKFSKKITILIIIMLPWFIYGVLFNESILAVSAMVIGIFLVLPISYALFMPDLTSIIETQIKLIITISTTILLIQTIIYYGTGTFIDVPGSFGAFESRGMNEGLNYFRPSGLFQEPNAYCVATFSMLTACAFFKKRNLYIEIFAIFSIFLSQSLWGFGGILVLIFLLYGLRILLIFVSAIFLVTVLYFVFIGIDIASLAESSVTLDRIININDDPSRQARFGSTQELTIDVAFLIGRGVDVVNFQSLAANALAFLRYSFGIVGSFIISLYILYLTRFNFKILISIGFLLTTFPQFSYMFFWSWLGILLSLAKAQRFDAHVLRTVSIVR